MNLKQKISQTVQKIIGKKGAVSDKKNISVIDAAKFIAKKYGDVFVRLGDT